MLDDEVFAGYSMTKYLDEILHNWANRKRSKREIICLSCIFNKNHKQKDKYICCPGCFSKNYEKLCFECMVNNAEKIMKKKICNDCFLCNVEKMERELDLNLSAKRKKRK